MQTAANACILALSTTLPHAARFSGSSDLNLVGCTVMSNSITSDAVKVQGSAKLSTDCIIAVGNVDLTSGATMTECPGAITNAPPAADPFADLLAVPGLSAGKRQSVAASPIFCLETIRMA